MECFCGCGRPVGFGTRSPNRKGARVAADLHDLETIVAPRLAHERLNPRLDVLRQQLARLQAQGPPIRDALAAFVHGDADRVPRDYAVFHREALSLIQPLKDKQAQERRDARG